MSSQTHKNQCALEGLQVFRGFRHSGFQLGAEALKAYNQRKVSHLTMEQVMYTRLLVE